MKLLRKQMLLCSILFLVFTLSACSAIGQTDENNLTDSATSAEKTVSVVRGTITPTVSTQTTIVPAVPFIISSPENGIFNTAVELEEKITAGLNAVYLFNRVTSPDNAYPTDCKPYLLTNFNIKYDFNQKQDIYLTINNILDRDDIVTHSASTPYYSTPINFMLGYEMKF